MRRAVLIVVAAFSLALIPLLSFAEEHVERPPDVMDGSGMVDFMRPPTFPIGAWVKYRTVSSSERGLKDDYIVTILIGGEEVWWGEPCFWVETRTSKPGDRERVTATLISYSAFGDTMADRKILWFVRKTIDGFKEGGLPDVSLYARNKSEVQLRREAWEKEENPARTDSLGPDSVSVPAGSFRTFKVRKHYGTAQTVEQGDSTVYYEHLLDRIFYKSHKIPITSLVRVDVDDQQRGKTWLAGKFDKSGLNMLERARGKTELIAFGTSGLTPLMVPVGSRHPIDRKLIQAAWEEPLEPAATSTKRRAGSH